MHNLILCIFSCRAKKNLQNMSNSQVRLTLFLALLNGLQSRAAIKYESQTLCFFPFSNFVGKRGAGFVIVGHGEISRETYTRLGAARGIFGRVGPDLSLPEAGQFHGFFGGRKRSSRGYFGRVSSSWGASGPGGSRSGLLGALSQQILPHARGAHCLLCPQN